MNNIGEFISTLRKEKGLTQEELANKLYVSDRTISKWERSKGLPSSNLMLPLCEILGITVNELLRGERNNSNDNINKINEEQIILLTKQKEEQDKKFLIIEICLGLLGIISSLSLLFISIFFINNNLIKIISIVIALVILFSTAFLAIFIEAKCGYYKCPHCDHKFVPSFKSVLFAMHINRTRYLKCPKCHKRGWNKKVLK